MPHLHPASGWTLAEWQAGYRSGVLGPEAVHDLLSSLTERDPAWIRRATHEQISAQFQALQKPAGLPLYGVPFAVKDNMDVAGWPTTAGCPAAMRNATRDATAVARLKAAGAILVGKTNLDQFATGLTGTRSPFGAVPNAFNSAYPSGGSSSGSASVVARGLVPFALGTDTAGSGRVPAGFNNIVGLKPTRGWLSTAGVVPACRSLDCVSVLALTVADAVEITCIAGGRDAEDPYSRENPGSAPVGVSARPRLAVPAVLEFFADREMERAFGEALARLQEFGVELARIDFTTFTELAEMLYGGPWIAERTLAMADILRSNPMAINPVVRAIAEQGRGYSACDHFAAEYHRAELSARINDILSGFDALVVPTCPVMHSLSEIEREPVVCNSRFGTYTNFVNLADLCALALPAAMRGDGLPAGITLIAPAWHDHALAAFGRRWQQRLGLPMGATGRKPPAPSPAGPAPGSVRLAVVGAQLSRMPLNHQLTDRNAVLAEATTTSADYRLYALAGTDPPRPGLVRAASGRPIAVELWDVPLARFGEFVAGVPPPLAIGSVTLGDRRVVKGFVCEPSALQGATDITGYGGWRAYIASR